MKNLLVFLQFALIFAHVIGGYNACESDVDCRKTGQEGNHCCRTFDANSSLACYNVSSCVGRHCKVDNECTGLCCILGKCKKCATKCRSDDECNKEVCCGIQKDSQLGECRSTCRTSCVNDDDCPALECCKFGKCIEYGCTYDKVVLGLIGAALGVLFLFLVVLVFYVLIKFNRVPMRRRTVSPVNLEMNETVLTMPTTYRCTNTLTTSVSVSQKE